jgi:hypothetical protein
MQCPLLIQRYKVAVVNNPRTTLREEHKSRTTIVTTSLITPAMVIVTALVSEISKYSAIT